MIITRLQIDRLHGIYDYNVKFNSNLTFIYGENGCGKTTILDIISSIVTGRIYNLFSYKFWSITLSYCRGKGSRTEKVTIRRFDSDPYTLEITGFNEQETITDPRQISDMYSREENELLFEHQFMSMYKVPSLLKSTFNYIYLPLGRNSQDRFGAVSPSSFRRRRALYSEQDVANRNYLNDSLLYVEEIIRSSCMRIASSENAVNSRFRSSIFTSSLKINSEYNFDKLLKSVIESNTTLASIEKSKQEYIKTLKEIREWNDETSKRVDSFFKKYCTLFEGTKKNSKNNFPGVTFDFILMHMEFSRIKEIAAQAQKIEEEKEKISAPITAFLSTVNGFFDISDDKKQIEITDEGRIVVKADYPHRELSLYNLSSGEKQIIIMFACLIFGLEPEGNGIYIIDEPEASLHLAWQKIFVESIKDVNSSVQLIFATHAPEIIGKNSGYAIKLKKGVSPLLDRDKGENYCDE